MEHGSSTIICIVIRTIPQKKESAHSGEPGYIKDKNEKKKQGISDKKTDPASAVNG